MTRLIFASLLIFILGCSSSNKENEETIISSFIMQSLELDENSNFAIQSIEDLDPIANSDSIAIVKNQIDQLALKKKSFFESALNKRLEKIENYKSDLKSASSSKDRDALKKKISRYEKLTKTMKEYITYIENDDLDKYVTISNEFKPYVDQINRLKASTDNSIVNRKRCKFTFDQNGETKSYTRVVALNESNTEVLRMD